MGGDRHSLPRDPGIGAARISRRATRERAGDAARQVEDDAAAGRRRLFDRGQGRRCGPAGSDADGAHAALALGLADAVHWLGLFPCRRAASDRGVSVEASLFRLGARAHRQAGGGDRAAGRDRNRGRPDDLAQPARRGIRVRVRESESDPRGDRPRPCPSRCRDRRCTRDRLLPADDGRIDSCSGRGDIRSHGNWSRNMPVPARRQREPFDVAAEGAALTRGRKDVGAVVTFTGICRGEEAGAPLVAMTLEHYPGMAEAEVARHVEAAEQRWPLLGVTVIHRYGRLEPGEEIVLVATAAAHRQDAFAAAEFLMDYLKTRAPFWKQVEYVGGKNWVDAKQSDDALADRWARPSGRPEAAE